jgi:hypothetical protein
MKQSFYWVHLKSQKLDWIKSDFIKDLKEKAIFTPNK